MLKYLKKVTVFCGASSGFGSEFIQLASQVGEALARNQVTIIYGGGNTGLMGAVANAALDARGEVYGYFPEYIPDINERAHSGLTKNTPVTSMHERKLMMANDGHGAIALPGGDGTMDESYEWITWIQLKVHFKPFGFLNYKDYFEGTRIQRLRALNDGFLSKETHDLVKYSPDIYELLQMLDEPHDEKNQYFKAS